MYFYSKDIQKNRQILNDFGITIICTKTHSLEGTDFRGLPFYPVVTFSDLFRWSSPGTKANLGTTSRSPTLPSRPCLCLTGGHRQLLNLKQAPHIKMTQDDSRCHLAKVTSVFWKRFVSSIKWSSHSWVKNDVQEIWSTPAGPCDIGYSDPLKSRNHQPTRESQRRTATWSLAWNEHLCFQDFRLSTSTVCLNKFGTPSFPNQRTISFLGKIATFWVYPLFLANPNIVSVWLYSHYIYTYIYRYVVTRLYIYVHIHSISIFT